MEIIRLMLQYGNKMVEYIGSFINEDQFEDVDFRDLFMNIIDRYKEGQEISIEVYAEELQNKSGLLGEMFVDQHTVSELGLKKEGREVKKDAYPFKVAQGTMKKFKDEYLERLEEHYRNKITNEKSGEGNPKDRKILREIANQQTRLQTAKPEEIFPLPEEDQIVKSDNFTE